MLKNKKRLAIICAILLAAALAVGVYAAVIKGPSSASGSAESKTINRVDFRVENTSFTYDLTETGQTFAMDIRVSAKKTEADFYAVINSISVSGLNYTLCTVSPSGPAAEQRALPDAVLPVKDGKPAEAAWDIHLEFASSGPVTASPKIVINYTSGVKAEVVSEYIQEFNISYRVVDKR